MAQQPPRLIRSTQVDLPVLEASGLATRLVDGRVQVLVVGDRTAHVAASVYDQDSGFSDWQTFDLATLAGWPLPARDSQFEAIAVDGGSLVALLCEDPPTVLVGDSVARVLRAQIRLGAPPGSPLDGLWDDPSSRGEGLVLLRGGRLLVAKEKRPRALVEFGPPGSPAAGLSRDDFLAPDEAWDAPAGKVEYVAKAVWRLRGEAKRALADLSGMAVGRDRSLWLLSDKSCCVGRLSLRTPLRASDDEISRLQEVWRFPKSVTKPEGIAALALNRVLVAMDTDSTRGNGMIVERPA
jgi:hypothetical protein